MRETITKQNEKLSCPNAGGEASPAKKLKSQHLVGDFFVFMFDTPRTTAENLRVPSP